MAMFVEFANATCNRIDKVAAVRRSGGSQLTVLEKYQRYSRRRLRRAQRHHQRLDIQGLRMIAILTVFACHLWGWPRGGFVGVDVFFVISGFLITGNLLRTAETDGNVSFRNFYWNRVRRIVPAATVVLALTFVACLLVFLPFRSHQVGIDALFAFFFLSNWRFAVENTDYFAQTDAVSPIQHYWSLSIEEQFYFVWPALIFAISLIVLRNAWTHQRRMLLTGCAMGSIIAVSLGWAMWETSTAPTWAYFDTLARVWELGVGALLATMVGALALIPRGVKPVLSWAGLGMIVASLFLISEESVGFPAPWGLLPVAGAALVVASGVGGEPKQGLLQNPASTYVGDISYSLYLVHWPVIVIVAALMEPGLYFSICVVALSFGLAIASYHLVENPLRRADYAKLRKSIGEILDRKYEPRDATKFGVVAAATLIVVGLAAYTAWPGVYRPAIPTAALAASAPVDLDSSTPEPVLGPLATALQSEIAEALEATKWPQLDPSMETAIYEPPRPSKS